MEKKVTGVSADTSNSLLDRLKLLSKRRVESIENSKTSLIYFFLTFFFAVSFRNFLEASLYMDLYELEAVLNLDSVIHSTSFYLTIASAITIILYLVTKRPIMKILKVVLPSSVILIVTPLVDFLIRMFSGVKGTTPGYIYAADITDLTVKYFTYFGGISTADIGATIGMRVTIFFVLTLCFIYVLIYSSDIIKGLLAVLLSYTAIFSSLALPSFLFQIDLLHLRFTSQPNVFFTHIFLICIMVFGLVIFFIYEKETVVHIIKDIRPYRLLHYELMFVLGSVLAVDITGNSISSPYDVVRFGVVVIAVSLAWLYSVFVNNIEDIDIDLISNEERPLIGGDLDERTYKKLSWALLFGTLLYAYTVSEVFLFLLMTYVASYFIYSALPLRFKRIPFLSKGFISLNSLVLVIAGFWFVGGSLVSLPIEVVILLLVGFTAVMNFIDIKDYEGDKAVGIKTLPVLLGLKKSKMLIGVFFLLTFLGAYFLFRDMIMLIPLSIFGLLELFFVTREDYHEEYVFTTYLVGLVIAIGLILFV